MASVKAHDQFCWKCCDKKATLQCQNCARSFHLHCADGCGSKSGHNWMCPVCIELEEVKNTDKKNELELLPMLVDNALKDDNFDFLKNDIYHVKSDAAADLLVNPINLLTIKEKIATYMSFEAFLADVEWILHNLAILFTAKDKKTKSLEDFYEYLVEEIKSIKICAECYANANLHPDSWFTMACNEPHLIIWAKIKGYNYWPAKLMSIDGEKVHARFFGDHTHANVVADKCLLFTKFNPSKTFSKTTLYTTAMKEANLYIENIRNKFCAFRFAESRIVLDPALLDQYILDSMPTSAEFRGISHDDNIPTESQHQALTQEENATTGMKNPSAVGNLDSKMGWIIGSRNGMNLKRTATTAGHTDEPQVKKTHANPVHTANQAEKEQNAITESDAQRSSSDQKCKQSTVNVLSDVTNSHQSQIDALKNEISELKEKHANEVAGLKNEAEVARNRARISDMALKLGEEKLAEYRRQSQLDVGAEKRRASEEVRKMKKNFRDKIIKIEQVLLKMGEIEKEISAIIEDDKFVSS